MPSSLLFAGLVATWLAVLVPMAARRRQPMSRPSDAALSCRVLERPRRGSQEVNTMDNVPTHAVPGHMRMGPPPSVQQRRPERYVADERREVRYRPGRGGYDPHAAALAAQAKYTFRQRMVLTLVLISVVSALIASVPRMPEMWWAHAGADVCLIGYLVYLRRQVRLEQAIRARRAARMAGSRRPLSADDPALDEWARRGRAVTRPASRPVTVAEAVAAREAAARRAEAERARDEPEYGEPEHGDSAPGDFEHDELADERLDDERDWADPHPDHAPVAEEQMGLPRIRPVPPPERPRGTVVLELDDEDPDLHDLDHRPHWGYRRAAGQ